MKKLPILILLTMPLLSLAQTGSEIYLFDINLSEQAVSISNPKNITNHKGYDSQPFFHASEPVLYYASFNDDGRSDIKFYNYETGKTAAFTTTNEREYSPTLTPDGQFISCIIQRDTGAQDLGKYPIKGGEAVTIIDNLTIGYHAWVDADNLILFVLGETMTLRWYDLNTQKDEVLTENIGRSLHSIPGEEAMSFITKQTDENWTINRLNTKTKEITTIVSTIKGSEDLTWTPDGRILMSDGEKLFIFDPSTQEGWEVVTMNKGDAPIKGITRLAITKDGEKLAVVVSE